MLQNTSGSSNANVVIIRDKCKMPGLLLPSRPRDRVESIQAVFVSTVPAD